MAENTAEAACRFSGQGALDTTRQPPAPPLYVVRGADPVARQPQRTGAGDDYVARADGHSGRVLAVPPVSVRVVDLEVPLHLLVDEKGRARKIYAHEPSTTDVQADIISAARAWPFEGHYLSEPRRDFFKIGAALFWAGYPEQALSYLEATLDRSPKNVQTMVLVGQVHLEAKRTAAARTILEQALAADPKSAEAWNEIGGVELAEGNPKRALDCYHKALEIKPDLTYALMNAAQAYAQLGDNAGA